MRPFFYRGLREANNKMSVPKKRRTASSVGQRRSHHALDAVNLSKCSQCGKSVRPHTACVFCGSYKGREAVKIKQKTEKKKEG
jgi:large subunit ribosomal protein L32